MIGRTNVWSRKRLDFSYRDGLAALGHCAIRWNRGSAEQAICNAWPDVHDACLTLSVRSGWDLYLQQLRLPRGSEVLMSALTIPDMVRIVEHHGLVPVPVDVDPETMAPTADVLRNRITDKTRVVLLAHLFGSRISLDPLIALTHEHGALFVEDCAQAYIGPTTAGHQQADVNLFSFGTIKTNTALGGAVIRIRDAEIRTAMQARYAEYPVQGRFRYFKRVLKYGLLKAISHRLPYRTFLAGCRLLGRDYDEMLNKAVRGFGGDGVERFRVQPSAPLLATMARRFRKFDLPKIRRQQQLGAQLTEQIRPQLCVPGMNAPQHHYWVYPVMTPAPAVLIAALRDAGFDATQGRSLCVVPTPVDRPDAVTPQAERILRETVYLPLYPALTESAVKRMGEVVVSHAAKQPAWSTANKASTTRENSSPEDAVSVSTTKTKTDSHAGARAENENREAEISPTSP